MKNGFLLFRGLLKRRPLRLLLTALCAFFCFLSYFGLLAAHASLEAAEEAFLSRCGQADILLSCEETSPGDIREMLLAIPGVESCSTAYRCDLKGVCTDGVTRTFRLLGFDENSLLSPILTGEGPFFVSYGYLSDFGGEHLSHVTLENGAEIELRDSCYLPSYTSVYLDRFTVSANGDIVDVFTELDTVYGISGEELANLAYVNAAPGADMDDLLQRIRENGRISVDYAIPFGEEPAFSSSNQLLSLVLRICKLFPVILFGTGLLFICIFLSGVASRSKRTVAILLSDGERFSGIFWGFFLAALLSVLAGMLTSLPASFLLAQAVAKTTAGNMGIPYPGLTFPFRLLLAGVGLCLAVSLLACIVCMLTVKGRTILALKRRQKKKKVSALLDVTVSCLCSAAALTLVFTTCMYRDSVAAVREEVFFERYGYDAEIIYSDFVPLTELEKLTSFGSGTRAEPILLGSAELSFRGKTCRVLGIGISEEGTMLRLRDGDGIPARPVQNQILLAEQTAQTLGVSQGDILQTEVTYGNRSIEILCLVSGVSRQYSAFTQIISIDTVTEYLDSSGVMNGAFVKLENAGEAETLTFLSYAKGLEGVYAVQLRSGAIDRFDNRFAGVNKLTLLIILDGAILGLCLFVLMGYGTWRKNLRKNSILLMLGKSPFRIALGDLAKGFAGALLGLLLGIPFSIFAEKRILTALSTDSTVYPLILRGETLLIGTLLICVYAAVTTVGYIAATGHRAKDIL